MNNFWLNRKSEEDSKMLVEQIDDLKSLLVEQKIKYQEATEIIVQLNSQLKNVNELEVRLHDEYEEKCKQVKNDLVIKIHEFLEQKSKQMDAKTILKNYTANQIFEEATN